jgi:hypothetical protein
MALGVTLFWQGKLEPALAHFRRGLEMFDPNMQFPDWPGSHPGVQCQFWPMVISWMLGYPDRSLDELRAAAGSAETLGHPLTLAQTLCWAAFVQIFRREPPAAADCAGRALRICEEHHIPQHHATALCYDGWALCVGLSGISKSQVSKLCKDSDERVNAFLDRPIDGEWRYLWLDATYLKVRAAATVAKSIIFWAHIGLWA